METAFAPYVYFLVRIVLGILFFFQAYDKIFRIKLENVISEVSSGNLEKGIPVWFSNFSVYVSSYLELVGGLLLIAGLFTIPILFLFGIHLIMIFAAFSFLSGVWNMQHVFPRFVLLIFLFLLPLEWNQYSLDHFLLGL